MWNGDVCTILPLTHAHAVCTALQLFPAREKVLQTLVSPLHAFLFQARIIALRIRRATHLFCGFLPVSKRIDDARMSLAGSV